MRSSFVPLHCGHAHSECVFCAAAEAVLTRIQLCELQLGSTAGVCRQTWTSEAEEALSILQIKAQQTKVDMI